MRLANILPGDIIRADWNGRRFYARVVGKRTFITRPQCVEVESLNGRPIPTHWLTARQVVEHFAKRGEA